MFRSLGSKQPVAAVSPGVISHCRQLLATALLVFSFAAPAGNEDELLIDQLLALQERLHIQFNGLEKITAEPKQTTRGNAEQQLLQILATYNHILSRDGKGRLQSVTIIGKKQLIHDQGIILPIRSQGQRLTVSASLSGDGGVWQTVEMIVDTGSDVVVLPESMIASLGLADYPFTEQRLQTVNGAATAKLGVLKELRIGGETVYDVETAFVSDAQLGDGRLLGMSVLGRYQLHIDEQAQLMTLLGK